MAVAGCLRGASHHIVSGVSFLQADKLETEVTVRHVYWRTEEMPLLLIKSACCCHFASGVIGCKFWGGKNCKESR